MQVVIVLFLSAKLIASLNVFGTERSDVKTVEDRCQEVLKAFVQKYYEKEKAVKVYNVGCHKCDGSTPIIKELIGQKNVLMYDHKMESSVFISNYGYLMTAKEINRYLLSILDHLSANGPWLVILDNKINSFNTEFLKVAWNEFRMLHLVILVFDHQSGCYQVYCYNPFTGLLYKELLDNLDSVGKTVRIINDRVRNLYGYSLNVYLNTDAHTYTIPVFDNRGNLIKYKGIDGELLEGIRHSLNGSISFVPERADMDFYVKEQLLNEMIHERKIDYLADARTLNKTKLVGVYPVLPITVAFIVCALRANQERHIIDVFYGFLDTTGTIVLYLTMTILAGCLFFLTRKLGGPYFGDTFSRFVIDIAGSILGVSRPLRLYTHASLRLVLASTFILYLSMSSIYQASIVRDLNVKSKVKQINTFDDMIRENITILGYEEFYRAVEESQTISATHRQLYKQFNINEKAFVSEMFQWMSEGSMDKRKCVLVKKYQAMYLQSRYLDPETGLHLMHLVQQHVLQVRMQAHIASWSPFVQVVNEMIVRVVEVGLLQKGYHDANTLIHIQNVRTWKKLCEENVRAKKRPKPVSFENLIKVFCVYFLFLVIAFISFLIEILYVYCSIRFQK